MQHTWTHKETGAEQSALVLQARNISLDLGRVEQIILKQKQASPEPDDVDDLPF